MDKNMKFGLIAFISIIALFVLSLWISQTPNDVDNSVRFGILTLIPPLVAIGLAFLTKQTIISLFTGVFIGEFMLNVNDYNILTTIISAFLDIGTRIISCMADPWNV
ncbi:MAG: Na+/H+ antiporter NhaC family protein, partial [Methanosphaera stadtmanae]|nr:Na+/H+ antiporter NhaC family protein [Methanosphaera stadtmanae]